jgi:hypothetical protein
MEKVKRRGGFGEFSFSTKPFSLIKLAFQMGTDTDRYSAFGKDRAKGDPLPFRQGRRQFSIVVAQHLGE